LHGLSQSQRAVEIRACELRKCVIEEKARHLQTDVLSGRRPAGRVCNGFHLYPLRSNAGTVERLNRQLCRIEPSLDIDTRSDFREPDDLLRSFSGVFGLTCLL